MASQSGFYSRCKESRKTQAGAVQKGRKPTLCCKLTESREGESSVRPLRYARLAPVASERLWPLAPVVPLPLLPLRLLRIAWDSLACT